MQNVGLSKVRLFCPSMLHVGWIVLLCGLVVMRAASHLETVSQGRQSMGRKGGLVRSNTFSTYYIPSEVSWCDVRISNISPCPVQTMGEYEAVKVRRSSAPLPSRGREGEGVCPPPPVFVRRPLPEYFRTRSNTGDKKLHGQYFQR